jgi:hypothetical protein
MISIVIPILNVNHYATFSLILNSEDLSCLCCDCSILPNFNVKNLTLLLNWKLIIKNNRTIKSGDETRSEIEWRFLIFHDIIIIISYFLVHRFRHLFLFANLFITVFNLSEMKELPQYFNQSLTQILVLNFNVFNQSFIKA